MMQNTKRTLLLPSILITSVFAVSACEKKEAPAEVIEESVKDATDSRSMEEVKNVEEATEDAAKDALNLRENEATKDAAEKMEEAIEEAADAAAE